MIEYTDMAAPQVDGIWRPEPWKNGKFLVTRYVEHSEGVSRRELLSKDKFSSFANIFESAEAAQDAAKVENDKIMAALIAAAESPSQEAPTETEDD